MKVEEENKQGEMEIRRRLGIPSGMESEGKQGGWR